MSSIYRWVEISSLCIITMARRKLNFNNHPFWNLMSTVGYYFRATVIGLTWCAYWRNISVVLHNLQLPDIVTTIPSLLLFSIMTNPTSNIQMYQHTTTSFFFIQNYDRVYSSLHTKIKHRQIATVSLYSLYYFCWIIKPNVIALFIKVYLTCYSNFGPIRLLERARHTQNS